MTNSYPSTAPYLPNCSKMARGNCILLLGASATLDQEALTRSLAVECGYPPNKPDQSLPAVIRYYQAAMGCRQAGRQKLVERLRQGPPQFAGPSAALSEAVARLPIRRLVDFGCGDTLAKALSTVGCPYTSVVKDHELAYANRSRTLLLRPFGALEQPETLVLDRDEQDHFLSTFEPSRPLLLDQLRLWLATQVLLWVGVDPVDPTWQRLHLRLSGDIHPQHCREYALAGDPAQVQAWQAHGITGLLAPDPAAWLLGLAQAVAALPPAVVDRLPKSAPLLGRRPYKFLDFYTADDADLFFGREAWAENLAASILAHPLLTLFALRRGQDLPAAGRCDPSPAAAQLPGGLCPPRAESLQTVRRAVQNVLDEAGRAAPDGEADLGSFLGAAASSLEMPLVIVLDQAEECFTVLADGLRQRWVTALAQALRKASSQVHWVLSLREDFAAELHDWSPWIPQLFATSQYLEPLDTPKRSRPSLARRGPRRRRDRAGPGRAPAE